MTVSNQTSYLINSNIPTLINHPVELVEAGQGLLHEIYPRKRDFFPTGLTVINIILELINGQSNAGIPVMW